MKEITNHRRKLLAALVLMLAFALPIMWGASAVQASLLLTHVTIPPAVMNDNATPAQVIIRLGGGDIGGSPFTNGADVLLDSTKQYAWLLLINNTKGPLHTFYGGDPISVTAADYCHMKIIIPTDMKNLDDSPAVVTFYTPSGYTPLGIFENNDYLYLPTGADVSWYITINGKISGAHNKHIDCTDLNVGEYLAASYCKMKINVLPAALQAAGATVYIYNINYNTTVPGAPAQFTGGETVILPVGLTISWYLKINGKLSLPHSKLVDCTPISVTTADYCNVLNSTGAQIDIYGYGSVAAGGSVLFPTGITVDWKLHTEGSYSRHKNVDCTPIVSGP